jgi:hypothetical protein
MLALQSEARRLGEHGLQGWRRKVADAAAPRLAGVTPLDERDTRAWIGVVFVALSAWYVGTTAARFLGGR